MPPKHKFTREQIIESAFRLVRKKGWPALTTRSIADDLGASARPIYSFFDSMSALEAQVVKKAVDLLYAYMTKERTGDPWHDHGIGYVLFAMEEKHLFRAVNDENHIALFKQYGDVIWSALTDALSDYPPFKGLSQERIYQIQLHRWLFAHGLAFSASNPPPDTWTADNIVEMIRSGSTSIHAGLLGSVELLEKPKKEAVMPEKDPRKMALQIAGLRMNETHLPEDERVFQDPYAEYFFPVAVRNAVKDMDINRAERAKYERMMPGVNGAIVCRIRFIDACLQQAIQTGFRQMVTIGAGYDTRPYRIEGVKENLVAFEVDHPITQQVKRTTVKEIFGRHPDHVTYVPVEFGKDRMDEALFKSGYRKDLQTLFVAEGLLMYIPQPAVDALLAFVKNASGPASAFVADFFEPDVVDGTSPLTEAQALKHFVEQEGAALHFGIPAAACADFFKKRGFRNATVTTPAACKQEYFRGASRNRPVSAMFNFVYAVV